MNQLQSSGGEALVCHYDYADQWTVAADIGVDDDRVHVDTIDDTAIVVVEGDGESVESEFTLPGVADRVSVTNGVLTIEGSQ